MTDHKHDIRTPAPILFAVGLLLAGVTAFVGLAQLTGLGVADLSNEAVVERMEVKFLDEDDGGVGAYDPESGAIIHVFHPGEGGFVRTALRSLNLNRRQAGFGPMIPYELHKSATGHVVLFDPATEKSITLDAFGDANENDFAQLFEPSNRREMP
ncbi:MAG: photosynthetic complex assembly protein PuhC [Pseudomonadota bacterium]